MIEPISGKELYDKFHELYVALIKHIVINISVTKNDGTAVDTEMLHRVQECCVDMFDELNLSKYQDALDNIPYHEFSTLAVLTYTISSIGDDELLPTIKERYKDKLSEEEFEILNELFDSVSGYLSNALSLSCKFLMSTNDLNLEIKE